MRHGKLTGMLSGLVATLLIFAAPAAAQTCEVCDDSDLSQTKCVAADWTEMGWSECDDPEGNVGACPEQEGKPDCWGQMARALDVRPDGTLTLAATGGPNDVAPGEAAQTMGVDAFGFSAHARIMERNCKGLILDRLYGEVTIRRLAAETAVIVI